ncbi:MAG: DUF1549 domain-containing protein [Prosthecobacter sp.]
MSLFRTTATLTALLALPLLNHAAEVDFSHQIVPLLRKHCADCHTGDKKKGGFSMNDRDSILEGGENGAVIDLKKPESSHLLEVVTTDDEDLRMPPEGDGLSPAEAALLKEWITQGLPWESGFAFKTPAYEPMLTPRKVALPPAKDGREHPVDRLIASYFEKERLPWPEPLGDEAFLRRAHLDLVGLLPTPEERAAFLANTKPDKRARLVEALLARDVDYTEHWLTFWNDLLRNDYGGTGFITGGRKQISKWLYDALIANMPFDQLARELIAPPTGESRGFIDGIKWRGDVSAGQTVEIQFAQSVGQSFLGINLKCASCHDSFIDRWKLNEAYGLAAIYSERPLEIHRCDKPVGETAKAGWLFPELGDVNPAVPQKERLRQLAELLTHPKNGRFTRTLVNRLWHRLMGRGIVHPLDAMQTEPWNADLLDYLADDFQTHGYDIKRTLALIATSRIYSASAEVVEPDTANATRYVFTAPRARRMTAEQFVDSVWQITGAAPNRFDAPVFRGKIDRQAAAKIQLGAEWIWGASAAEGKPPPGGERLLFVTNVKLDAAVKSGAAIVTCDNEFTLYLNGRSVISSDNWENIVSVPLHDKLKAGNNQIAVVGTNGATAPNPAGLYFEARLELEDSTTQTIRSDSSWKWGPRKEPGKEGRLGAVPKNLAPVTIVKPVGPWQKVLRERGPTLLAQGAEASATMVRASLLKSDFLMRSLGRPNRDQIVSMRPNELTTLEAIDLANGAALAEALTKGAAQLSSQPWPSSRALIRHLFHHALSRDPTAGELAAASDLLGDKPTPATIEDTLWTILMLPEFQLVR